MKFEKKYFNVLHNNNQYLLQLYIKYIYIENVFVIFYILFVIKVLMFDLIGSSVSMAENIFIKKNCSRQKKINK